MEKIKTLLSKNYPVFVILFFIAAVYSKNLIFWSNKQTFIFGDTAIYSLNIAGFAKNIDTIFTFKNNYLFWNPNYLSGGIPTLSQVDSGILYPPNIIIAILARTLNNNLLAFPLNVILIFLHLFFGAYFVYKLLTKHWSLEKPYALTGALLWTYIGYNTEFMAASVIMESAAYLPICLYFKLKHAQDNDLKSYFSYFLFLTLSFLVGYPMVSLIILTFCFFFTILLKKNSFKLSLKKELIGLFLIVFPIISPLYITSALNVSKSIRGNRLTLDSFMQNPAKVSNILESFVPKNTPFNTNSKTNIMYLYFSLVGILIFIQATDKKSIFKNRYNIIIAILGITGLLLSIGKYGILSYMLYLIPGASFFRRLSVFSLIPLLVFCLLIPQYLILNTKTKKFNSLVITLTTLMIIVIAPIAIYSFINKTFTNNFWGLVISTSILIFFDIALIVRKSKEKLFLPLVILILLFEAKINVTSKFYLNSKVNPMDVFKPNELITYVQDNLKPMQRVDLLQTPYSYSTNYLNIEQTQGYISMASRFGSEINERLTSESGRKTNIRDIVGIKYILRKGNDLEEIEKPKVFDIKHISYNYISLAWEKDKENTKYNLYVRKDPLPRLYIASHVEFEKQNKELLLKLANETDSKKVFVDRNYTKTSNASKIGNLEILSYFRNYIKAKVTSKGRIFVANSTPFYSGWLVRIDGKLQKPIQTNWFMMGTFVPKGNHIIEFIYIPYGIIFGLIYILVATLIWIFIFRVPIQFYQEVQINNQK